MEVVDVMIVDKNPVPVQSLHMAFDVLIFCNNSDVENHKKCRK
jgi:hypothetical protein